MDVIIRCPKSFFYSIDKNIYINNNFSSERLEIKLNKPNVDYDFKEKKYTEFVFSDVKHKQIILRYLFFVSIFVPKNGYIMHNYDYSEDDYPTELLSIYTDFFYFNGTMEKFTSICDEIMKKLPLCIHFILDNENIFYADDYLLIHKLCNKCKNENENQKEKKNMISVHTYYNCIYQIFKTNFNCPYEISKMILDNLQLEDIFINKELLDLNIIKLL